MSKKDVKSQWDASSVLYASGLALLLGILGFCIHFQRIYADWGQQIFSNEGDGFAL